MEWLLALAGVIGAAMLSSALEGEFKFWLRQTADFMLVLAAHQLPGECGKMRLKEWRGELGAMEEERHLSQLWFALAILVNIREMRNELLVTVKPDNELATHPLVKTGRKIFRTIRVLAGHAILLFVGIAILGMLTTLANLNPPVLAFLFLGWIAYLSISAYRRIHRIFNE